MGKHSDSIGKLIVDIQVVIQDMTRISDKLQLKLNKAAMIRGKVGNENPYLGVVCGGAQSVVVGSSNAGVSAQSNSTGTDGRSPSRVPSIDERTFF